ncbi:DNA recombination-dependent growth factor C [plant metagenome]|uniref:DNA recombination-dependent growth factor C n=1 Tax=plant metagenome TaxID=1297885 RepID=A0A484U1K3_9ZZZZ
MLNKVFFRNASVYRLAEAWQPGPAALAEQLAAAPFTPCGTMEAESVGWVSPAPDTDLVYDSAGHYLLTLRIEQRVMPAAAVNLMVRERAAKLEEQQGFKPGKRQMKEIKEAVRDEMLPQAFRQQKDVRVWIDTRGRTLVVDSASPAQCDVVMGILGKCVDPFPVEPFQVQSNPALSMTAWLQSDAAPDTFTIDTDVELRSAGDAGAVVRYQRQAVDPSEVTHHINGGKQVTLLGLTWNDRVAFLLDDGLHLKRIVALDLLTQAQDRAGRAESEQFAADFNLMAGELSGLIGDLTYSLGGLRLDLAQQAEAAEQEVADHADQDELLHQARDVVIAHDRASISLIQRSLRIGYNRAARLLETLEKLNVVSPMNSDGTRAVLA